LIVPNPEQVKSVWETEEAPTPLQIVIVATLAILSLAGPAFAAYNLNFMLGLWVQANLSSSIDLFALIALANLAAQVVGPIFFVKMVDFFHTHSIVIGAQVGLLLLYLVLAQVTPNVQSGVFVLVNFCSLFVGSYSITLTPMILK